jgi:hypothetical protein
LHGRTDHSENANIRPSVRTKLAATAQQVKLEWLLGRVEPALGTRPMMSAVEAPEVLQVLRGVEARKA